MRSAAPAASSHPRPPPRCSGRHHGAVRRDALLDGEHPDLFLKQPGLLFVVILEEEGRRNAERAGKSLDHPQLRIGGLAVTQLPDRRVGDLLTRDLLDQGGHLGVSERAPFARACVVEQSVDLIAEGAQPRVLRVRCCPVTVTKPTPRPSQRVIGFAGRGASGCARSAR